MTTTPANTPNITCLRPGNTTLQDLGRRRFQHLGYSQGGAADEHAFMWANKLLHNPENTPCFEIMFSGAEFVFSSPTQISVAGAASDITINGVRHDGWQSFNLDFDSHVKISQPKAGLYTYIAVKDGLDILPSPTGYATVSREKSGFNLGAPFSHGEHLPYTASENRNFINKSVPPKFIPDYRQPLKLGFIPGFQIDDFDDEQIDNFLDQTFTIEHNSNKMGYRLSCSTITHAITIPSEGIPLGSIQLPPDGHPIILLKDRQTIGGYPKLGTVAQIDCFKLSQKRPGEKIQFYIQSLGQATQELQRFYRFFS